MKNFLRLTTTLILLMFLGGNAWGQIILEGFETGMPTSYTTGTATLGSGTWSGTNFIRGTTKHSGSYSCQIKSATGAEITTPNIPTGGVGTVTLWATKSTATGPALQVLISIDGGAFTQVGSTLSLTQNTYNEFSVDVNDASDNIRIQFYRTSGTVYIDDVSITQAPASGPENPGSFSATASSTSQIDLTWAQNGSTDNVMIVFDEDGSFDNPVDGTAYNVSASVLGGTVIFNGSGTLFNHQSLTLNTQYFYKAWSVDGDDNYSSGVTDDATTLTPTITVSTNTLSDFTYLEGNGPSAEQTFTVEGSNLTNNITFTLPTNYEISETSGSGFSTAVVLTPNGSGTVASKTIYVRLIAGLSEGDYNGENITATSTDADNKTVTCSGSVTGPVSLPYTEDFANCGTQEWIAASVASNRDWTCGSGYQSINGYGGDVASDDYLISPVFNLNSYSGEVLTFDSWTQFSDDVRRVELLYTTNYTGDPSTTTWNSSLVPAWPAANSTTWTGSGDINLSAILGTTIRFAFHYTSSGNGAGTTSEWHIDNIQINAIAGEPTNHPSSFTATPNGTSQIDLSWAVNDGSQAADGFLIQAESNGIFTDPIDKTDPAEDTDLSDGSALVKVPHGTPSHSFMGLTAGTNYFFKIWPYTNSGLDIDFKTNGDVHVATAKTDDAPSGGGTTNLLTVDFETIDDGYSASGTEGSGDTDVFNRSNPNIGGNSTYLWAVEDLSLSDPSITLDQIAISGFTSFSFSIDFLTPNTEAWDSTDELLITYSIDGGGYENLIWVEAGNDDDYNEPAQLDLDFNGEGDDGQELPAISDTHGAGVGSDFETFSTSSIPITGSTLDITLQFNNLTSGDEGIYIDNIVISGISPAPATITWDNGGADNLWNTPENWDGDAVPTAGDNVVIPFDGQVTISSAKATANCNDITIESTSDGTGSLIIEGTLIVAGTAVSELYLDAYTSGNDGWHLLSSPVDNMELDGSDFVRLEGYDDLFMWDEVNYQWLNYDQSGFTNFTNGIGYLVAYSNLTAGTKEFEGTLNNANITHPNLSVTSGQGNGWHLLGNPFQSTLHWTNSASTWNPNNIYTAAKVLQGRSLIDVTSDGVRQHIPANQGFFVKATNATNSITIPTAERVHNTTSYYKSGIANALELSAINGNEAIKTWVQILDKSTNGYDENLDINYLSIIYDAPQFFSIVDDEWYVSTNRVPEVNEITTIQLGFRAYENTEFTLFADLIDSFDDDLDLILEDTQEDVQIDLRKTAEYTFMANADELTERFKLHLLKTTGIHEAAIEGLSIYSHANTLYLNSDKARDAQVEMYNVTGQKVMAKKIVMDGLTQINANLTTGWYVVKVSTAEGIATQKVFIN